MYSAGVNGAVILIWSVVGIGIMGIVGTVAYFMM